MSLPVPIDTPPRAVLHYRNRTALALLNQRPPTRATAELVRRVLSGDIDTLIVGPPRPVAVAGG